jgi:hypothetical protein
MDQATFGDQPATRDVIQDVDRPLEERLAAARELAASSPQGAIDALLVVASRSDEAEEALRAVGHLLGVMPSELGDLSEWDMRDMAGVAFDAYCESLK